jgi:hypothetical protein
MNKLRLLALAAVGVAALAAPSILYAAGSFSTLPIVGAPATCVSVIGQGPAQGGATGTGAGSVGTNGTICGSTMPAGPQTLTGSELIPADTGLAGGAAPQTVTIPSSFLGAGPGAGLAMVNRIIGGDFNTNLWQRGTTPLSAASPTTTTMGADRWGVYNSNTSSQGSTVTVIKETGATDTIASQGLYASMRVQRVAAQTGTNDICVGQVFDKNAAQAFLGNNMVLSYWALAGGNYSPTSSNLKVTVAYYTAADSATAGTNTDAWMKATVTGYQAAVGGVSPGTTGTVSSGVATVPISTTWTRYSVYAPIPTVNASATAVTGVGVSFCMTPVGTASTNDWFELEGVQAQATSSVASVNLPNGVTSPTAFERRPAALEQTMQLYYSYILAETAGTTPPLTPVPVLCSASGAALITIPFPVAMREVPAYTLTAAGGWKIQTAVAQTAIGTTTSVGATTASSELTSGAACTSTLPYQLVSTGTTGVITYSAEP